MLAQSVQRCRAYAGEPTKVSRPRTGSGGLRMSSVAGGAPAASATALIIASASGYSGYAAAFERALCSGFMHSMYSETSICAGLRVLISAAAVPSACALQASAATVGLPHACESPLSAVFVNADDCRGVRSLPPRVRQRQDSMGKFV